MTRRVTRLFRPYRARLTTVLVLIVVSALLALDAALAAVGRRLGWTKEVGWLGATMGVATSVLFSVVLLAGFGQGSRDTARLYQELTDRMAAVDRPLGAPGMRLMSNFPIWVAETQRVSTLALPDEAPADVLDLVSEFPDTRYLIGRPISRQPALARSASCRSSSARMRAAAWIRSRRRPSMRSAARGMPHDRALYSEPDGRRRDGPRGA